MKEIEISLSPTSIKKAIKEIKSYQKELDMKTRLFAEKLAERGVYIAKMNIAGYGAIDSGELYESIDSQEIKAEKGIYTWTIFTDCPHAKFLEFGFGIRGLEAPHPDSSLVGWEYDQSGHSYEGWYYYKDGAFHWSNGQPSKPFMYETGVALRQVVKEVAREVFGT
jgi:hypothetical protein